MNIVTTLLQSSWQHFDWHVSSPGQSAAAELVHVHVSATHMFYSLLARAFSPQPHSISAFWPVLISRPVEGRRQSWMLKTSGGSRRSGYGDERGLGAVPPAGVQEAEPPLGGQKLEY